MAERGATARIQKIRHGTSLYGQGVVRSWQRFFYLCRLSRSGRGHRHRHAIHGLVVHAVLSFLVDSRVGSKTLGNLYLQTVYKARS